MKTSKTVFLSQLGALLSTILFGSLLISYAALAQTRRGDAESTATIPQSPCQSAAPVVHLPREPLEDENDPKFLELRDRFLEHFLGLGNVSPAAHAKAVAAARALPLSPLVGNWTFQATSPLWNQYTASGDQCHKPFPPASTCGASSRVDAIAVDPSNADIVYVGTNGGLSKSTDGGQSWTYVWGAIGVPSQKIKSIAIDPVAPNIIYAGTGVEGTGVTASHGKGIYRSTNSGATWTTDLGVSQFSGKTVGKIAIDPRTAGSGTSTTLYASVTDNGNHTIWKSTNSGITWGPTPIRGPTPNAGTFYDIVVTPQGPLSTVYATAPDGLFKSTNGGTNWPTSIHPRVTPPNPSAAGCLAFINSSSTLYIAFSENGQVTVALSNDGGASWTERNPTAGGVACFGVDPTYPNRIFVGGQYLRYSTDGGYNWLTPQNVHIDNHSIAFCPTNPPNTDRNYLGTDGGIYRADYGGAGNILWYSKNENLAGALMVGISISSDDHMAIGTQDNGTQLGWAGQNPPWTQIWGGDGGNARIDQTNSNKLYWIYYESDDEHELCGIDPPDHRPRIGPGSAAPWLWVNGVQTNVTPTEAYCELSYWFPGMFVAPNDSARVIMGFQNVWRSTNSGTSWTRIGGRDCSVDPNNCGIDLDPIKLTVIALAEARSDTNVIYAVTAIPSTNPGIHIFVTTNANSDSPSWTQVGVGTLPGDSWIRAVTVHPTAPQTAYVAGIHGVYKTTNAGGSWIYKGLTDLGCYDLAIDPAYPEHLFASTTSGVSISTDGGSNWASTNGIPLGMTVTSLSFNTTSRQLAAATYGRGAYVLDLDDVPPAVSITSPIKGAVLSGTTTVSATASDNHLVAGVQFKLDGANLGSEERFSPYSISWNTTTSTNGLHTLTAVARDPAGNIKTSVSVQVTVSN